MIPLIYGALAGAGMLANAATSYFGNRQQNKANIQLQREAQNFELEQWNRMNEYNTPVMQMQRLKDAGLNPNLMYSQGNVGNATSYAKPHVAQVMNELAGIKANIPELISLYQDTRIKDAQISNIQANTDNINARTITESIRPVLLGNQAALQDVNKNVSQFNLDLAKELRPYSVSIKSAELEKRQKENAILNWRIEKYNPKQLEYVDKALGLKALELALQSRLAPYGVNMQDGLLRREGAVILGKAKEGYKEFKMWLDSLRNKQDSLYRSTGDWDEDYIPN